MSQFAIGFAPSRGRRLGSTIPDSRLRMRILFANGGLIEPNTAPDVVNKGVCRHSK
jgi:hypothetical protein